MIELEINLFGQGRQRERSIKGRRRRYSVKLWEKEEKLRKKKREAGKKSNEGASERVPARAREIEILI